MLFCHLCLLISCYSLVFWILSFECFFCLIAWYLYFYLGFEVELYHFVTEVAYQYLFKNNFGLLFLK